MIKAFCVVLIGLGVAYAGWRVLESQKLPEGAAGFEGVGPSGRGVKIMAGYLLLVLGLILSIVFGPMFFIGAR